MELSRQANSPELILPYMVPSYNSRTTSVGRALSAGKRGVVRLGQIRSLFLGHFPALLNINLTSLEILVDHLQLL